MDNAAEFSSKAFNEYCMALGINVEHCIPYVHTQNGLAESLIKRIKLVARPLLHNCNLPSSCWGHAVLHAADLIQLRPTAYHTASPLQLVHGNQPNIFPIYENSDARYTYRFHHRSIHQWAPIENWGYMWGINHRQS